MHRTYLVIPSTISVSWAAAKAAGRRANREKCILTVTESCRCRRSKSYKQLKSPPAEYFNASKKTNASIQNRTLAALFAWLRKDGNS